MSYKLQIISTVFAVGLVFFIIELIRRRKLKEEYAIVWIIVSSIIFILAFFEDLLWKLADSLGFQLASNALFTLGTLFIVVVLINLTVAVSSLSVKNNKLVQKTARLQLEIERLKKEKNKNNI